jgi:hypothetical protein
LFFERLHFSGQVAFELLKLIEMRIDLLKGVELL